MISMKTSGSRNMAQIWNKSEVIILYKRFSFQGIYLWPCFWDAIYVEIQKQKSKNSWTTQIKKRNFQNTSPAKGKYPNPVLNCRNGTQHIIELDFWFEIHCAPICQRGFHKLQPVNHTFSWCQYDIMVLLKEILSMEISSSSLWCPPLVSQVTLPNSCDKSTVFLLHWILRLHVQSCKVSCHPLARQESWLERQALPLWPSRLLSHDRVKKTLSIICHNFEWPMFTTKYFRTQLRSRSTMSFLKIML